MDVPQPRLVDERDAPTLSIVIPSFNHSQYIRRTIDSILRQPFKQVELIVVDGGSKDGTVDILCDYMTRFPDRFRFVSEPDDGQSDALNKGIAMARGEIIGWQNADDYYLPGAFEKPVSYLL